MKDIRLAAIIVSAGYSSRMGSFKPFLKFGARSAIEILVDTYKSCGIDNIIVVTGYRGSEVADSLRDSGARCVQNANYAQGMFTSVVAGIEALDADVAAFFMQPVDIPLVKKYTIEVLKGHYPESRKGIIYPEFLGRTGHPPLIDCRYREAILSSNGEGGLKRILQEHADDSITIPVFDKAVLMDMDTREDYEKLLAYFYSAAPDMEECGSILDIFKVPENIVRHGRQAAEVAAVILRSLDKAGCRLDENALKAAAMLHDMARQEKNHARAGEKILRSIGYDKVGSIIGSHMDIEVDDNGPVSEGEILYLADKLVGEDEVISLEDRFGRSLDKCKDNPEALTKIESRRDAAYKIIKKIETVTGEGFIYG